VSEASGSRPFGPLDIDTDWAARERAPSSQPTARDDLEEPAETWPEESDVSGLADTHVTIPGMGDRSVGCGEWGPREFCDTCGELHMGPHRCQQRECPGSGEPDAPACWSTWATQRSESVVRRVQAGRWSQPDGIERRSVHVVVSPPEGSVSTLADIQRYRKKAHEKAKAAGIRGGVCVFHGFRITDEAKRRYRESEEADGRPSSAGAWRFVRENDRYWRDQVYWSPHYHYVGLASEVESDGSEWVVERLSTADAFESLTDRGAYESVARQVSYIMSHATFEPTDDDGSTGRKAVTWFGSLHPSNFQAEEELSEGVYATIRRYAMEVTGAIDPDEEGGALEEPRECPGDRCDGRLRSIYDFPTYSAMLKVDQETERELSTAFEWAVGDIMPPPGLRRPRSRDECREVFKYLLDTSG
jgi:hypothetical protein